MQARLDRVNKSAYAEIPHPFGDSAKNLFAVFG